MERTSSGAKKIEEGFIGEKRIVIPPNVKKRFVQNKLIHKFYLTAIGYYPHANFHDIERKSGCPEYILIYCVEGNGTIEVGEKTFLLKPNNFFIIQKKSPHRYYSDKKKPWSIYWVHFSGDLDEHIYSRSLINDKPDIHYIPYEEIRIKLFEKIYHLLEHGYHEHEMEILNLYLLHFVTSLIYYKETDPTLQRMDMVSSSIAYMNNHLTEQISLQEFADQQHISPSHLSRIFKQKTGYSPLYYFNLLKIQKSCQYLYFTDRSIKEICIELGFEDPYYFSRLFRKLIGISPANYRKMQAR
ncbi:AraC-type DNA-binding protein [bacterium A37T11]|nr:AraC-type DNA-binding protein [bacterium A37T11]